jgi:hypothetical protein
MNAPTFRWKYSYMGCVSYMVTDETGTYEAEIRHGFSDYESSITNGDLSRQEAKSAIGVLRRHSSVKLGADRYSFAMPRATVDAFNAWRSAEHARHVAQIKAQPERYGIIPDSDPIFAPPMAARWADYVFGEYRWA